MANTTGNEPFGEPRAGLLLSPWRHDSRRHDTEGAARPDAEPEPFIDPDRVRVRAENVQERTFRPSVDAADDRPGAGRQPGRSRPRYYGGAAVTTDSYVEHGSGRSAQHCVVYARRGAHSGPSPNGAGRTKTLVSGGMSMGRRALPLRSVAVSERM